MRIPVALAWVIIVSVFFTAGLLRQFHGGTPRSPYISPVVGSLLFAALVFLLLVAAREWRRGAVPGPGIRLGNLTPLLLMLLMEKWISLALYNPIFYWLHPMSGSPEKLDAQFRAFAGVALLGTCLLISRFSVPTARKTWRRAGLTRWPIAAVGTLALVAVAYGILGAAAWGLGAGFRLYWPPASNLLLWILGGQALLAFAEEVYYRGLLMSEAERLAPRLGVRSPTARRWSALLLTSMLFGMEHIRLNPPWSDVARQLVFTVALGLLFGLLIMMSANLHLAAAVHAWINWVLLGAAPYFVDESGQPVLPAGTYIGLTLILAFVSAFLFVRWRHGGSRG